MADKPEAASIRVEREGPISILHFEGELDALNGPQLEETAKREMDEGARRCIINLADASFIDSIGVGSLIRSHRAAMSKEAAIIISGAHGMIDQLIRVTQLHRIFKVLPTAEDALTFARADLRR